MCAREKNKLQIECDQKELETEKRSNPKLNRQFTKNGGLSIPKRCEEQWRRKVVYAQGGDCLVDNVLLYQLRRPRDHFGCRYVLKKAHSFFLVFFTPPSWRFVVNLKRDGCLICGCFQRLNAEPRSRRHLPLDVSVDGGICGPQYSTRPPTSYWQKHRRLKVI